jgi:hypothetical protein
LLIDFSFLLSGQIQFVYANFIPKNFCYNDAQTSQTYIHVHHGEAQRTKKRSSSGFDANPLSGDEKWVFIREPDVLDNAVIGGYWAIVGENFNIFMDFQGFRSFLTTLDNVG